MRTLLDSFLECGVPFLHFSGDGVLVTGSPEAWQLLRGADDGLVPQLASMARSHRAAGPTMAQPNEFAVPFANGLALRLTAFPLRTASGQVDLIVVLAIATPTPMPAAAPAISRSISSPADEWFSAHQLTSREREVAAQVATGHPSPLIAERLGISVHTVRRHTERVFTKLGVRSRAELARRIGQLNSARN